MDQWRLQQAVEFLVHHAGDADLTKPMIIHAIRVGEILYNTGSDEDTVIAGYLHDLIEDTGVTADMIDQEFGVLVSEIVVVNTIDDEARNDSVGKRKYFEKIANVGVGAVSVKAADLADNLQHYRAYHDEEKWIREREGLSLKRDLFLEICQEYKDTSLYRVIESYSFEDHDALYLENYR